MSAEGSDVTSDLARSAGELRERLARLTRRLRQEDRGHTLTMSQLTALGRLDRTGPATLSALAAGERVRPQSMARTVDSLEAAGLVRRAPHPTDRRQNVISLTEKGAAVITHNRLRRDAWLARAMASALTDAERDVLIAAGALMDRLAGLPADDRPDEPPPPGGRAEPGGGPFPGEGPGGAGGEAALAPRHGGSAAGTGGSATAGGTGVPGLSGGGPGRAGDGGVLGRRRGGGHGDAAAHGPGGGGAGTRGGLGPGTVGGAGGPGRRLGGEAEVGW